MICGTRGSLLAEAQTRVVIGALKRLRPGIQVTVRKVRTAGDVFRRRPISELGGIGAFVREIDDLLLDDKLDFAVHSLKDVPTKLRGGIEVAAILPRGDPRDFLVCRVPLSKLPSGARVGTSSLRRRAQLLRRRGDLIAVPLRGNVPTRVNKVSTGDLDGAMVAKAGLDRLCMAPRGFLLPIKDFVPAPAQGAIAVVARTGSDAASLVKCLDHRPTRLATETERIVMRLLGGGCTAPVGIYAKCISDKVTVKAMILSIDGKKTLLHDASFPRRAMADGTRKFAAELRRLGGGDLVKEAARAALDW
ncbi:MAG: hydroxymethylbilane synthase [Thermoplasmatota archaeon]|nr:hydroxymethylbilane synthase [Candidatus Thermoplasmatota archaeon]MBU1914002.1 hydroxymethylbilane synthase [Candidatus Thermoplasmatota archaeon]